MTGREFYDNQYLRSKIAASLLENYGEWRADSATPPAGDELENQVDGVITAVLSEIVDDIRESYVEMFECAKVDECVPKAHVSLYIASWLESRMA